VSILTNTSMPALDRVPEHLVVIGGSYIGWNSPRCTAGSAPG
jgi:pyruvate/2-oxoglutarate dehydrogenase complex dihydrolipoamide dehydrogenase (E3) component